MIDAKHDDSSNAKSMLDVSELAIHSSTTLGFTCNSCAPTVETEARYLSAPDLIDTYASMKKDKQWDMTIARHRHFRSRHQLFNTMGTLLTRFHYIACVEASADLISPASNPNKGQVAASISMDPEGRPVAVAFFSVPNALQFETLIHLSGTRIKIDSLNHL